MKRAHYLQHIPFEGLGSIEAWLQKNDYQISHTELYQSTNFPTVNSIDLLIIMGGPMSIHDEDRYPWLKAEKSFIREAISQSVPVLGVCLGAQLIADVLGARVYPNTEKEIGWFPIRALPKQDNATFTMPDETTVFHWHGETFELPKGATCLAESAACKHQAFQWGDSVIGLQFHLETTPNSAQALVDNCRDELTAGAYIQSADAILSVDNNNYQTINRLMSELLGYLTKQ